MKTHDINEVFGLQVKGKRRTMLKTLGTTLVYTAS